MHQFDIPTLLLAWLTVSGLWVILVASPFLRHTFWWFSSQGRRAESFTPVWTRDDFEGYLFSRQAVWASGLSKLLSCSACQSFHSGWIATLLYLQQARVSLSCSEDYLQVFLLFLAAVAVFFITYTRILQH